MNQRDRMVLNDLTCWLVDGKSPTEYVLGLSRMRDQALRQRNFLRTLVDRNDFPEVESWLWIEEQAELQDPTPLKQAGGDVRVRHLDTVDLYERVKRLIEHRNETISMIDQLERSGMSAMDAITRYQDQANEFEQMLVELGNIVGVECLQSGGK